MIRRDLPNYGPAIAILHPTHDAPSGKRPLPSFLSRLTPDGAVGVVVIRSFAMGVPAHPRRSPTLFPRYRRVYGVGGRVTRARPAAGSDADCDGNCRMRIPTAQRDWCSDVCVARMEAGLDADNASLESVTTARWVQRCFGTSNLGGSSSRCAGTLAHTHAPISKRSPQRPSTLSAPPWRSSDRNRARNSHDRRTTARC